MADRRHSYPMSAISMANKYRLNQAPVQQEKKKIMRKKKLMDSENYLEIKSSAVRNLSDASDHTWLMGPEDEEFDFDAEEDGFIDAAPDGGSQPHQIYSQACSGLDIRPIRCIYEALKAEDEKVSCRGLVMKRNDVQACTIALLGATAVETLDFDGNLMGKDGAEYFGDVVNRNRFLTSVRLTYNALGTAEAKAICRGLLKNQNLKVLDLTGNMFNETDAKYFKELLEENSTIKELYLGHNYFREAGGELIAEGLANNDFVEILDLSWNHLRLKGAAAIGRALMKNLGLLALNISWNGFHIQGCTTLSQSLEVNSSLVDLDLSCNRLSESCIALLMKSLQKNTTLTHLRIGKNCLSARGATSILGYIKQNLDMGLEYIDLGDQSVEEDFIALLREINEKRPLQVKHGGVWSNEREPIGTQDPTEDELALLNENPLYVLVEMMKVLGFRLVDLFHILDKDQSKTISTDEFKEGLEAVNIPLKRKSLERFVKGIDSDKNGEVDYLEFAEANRQYKSKMKQYLIDGVPLETTDVGRISKLVRKIIKENELMHATKYETKE